jgi:hypothetical protein
MTPQSSPLGSASLPIAKPSANWAKEERLWAAVHADEVFIGESTAKTLLGVEIQLWCIVSHDVPQWEWELAVFRRDISAFDGLDEHLDWSTRVALQAIRSLRAMGGEA